MKPGWFSPRQALIMFASTVFLVFLFLNARVIDPVQHQRTLEDLDEISTLDSQIDEQVVKLRYRLLNNYAGLVVAENDLKLRRDDLKTNRLFQQEDERIGKAVRQWEQAEGVETEQQRDFLERNGCHAHQGYLFARPVPIEEFGDSLARLPNWRRNSRHSPPSEPSGRENPTTRPWV